MKSYEFNREVTIEFRQVTKDPKFGTDVISWQPLVPVVGSPSVGERFPASVQDALPSRSQTVLDSVLAIGPTQTRIRIPYRTDVDGTMRVVVHGDVDRVMKIVGGPAEGKEPKSFIEIVCESFTS